MAYADLKTGPVISQSGAYQTGRSDKTGAIVTTDGHGRYQEAVLAGSVFFACNTASQALSLNSTTSTGLILSNPLNSGVQLVLLELNVSLQTAPAGISTLVLSGNITPSTTVITAASGTPLVVQSAQLGVTKRGAANAFSAATTIGTTIFRPVGGGPVATGSVNAPFIKDEIAGAIVVQPGVTIALQCLTTAISVIASIHWEEVPLSATY